jgi:hypothetical protein
MDATGFGILLAIALPLAACWRWQSTRVRRANSWPTAEATIQSGANEVVSTDHGIDIILPVLAFTYYVAGECYSGRFSLRPYLAVPCEGLIERLTDTRLPVHYNPRRPAQWYISVEYIEGSKVEQNFGFHLTHYYPE